MRVSLNSIKQFTKVDLPSEELISKVNAQLGVIEKTLQLGKQYEKATIAKIISCEKHPNADKLSICQIDAGTGETVQVVCGAPNVREGLFVVWLPPGATVPSSFEDKEPFVLGARELRGAISNGMLASAKELGIGESHDGILEIDPTEWKPNSVEITPGVQFAEAYGLDDTVIDIENKMFTHRPDLFGQLGVAREIAGIQHQPFTSPEWYKTLPVFESAAGLALNVFNEASEKVPRFMTVVLKDITVKPSPLWLQVELIRLGGKPINNIVDVTNYIMLLTAQPTHAYDYDKVRDQTLGVRFAAQGEKIMLLNHKEYELDTSDIVIVDGQGPVGLAGIMGGGDSEVSNDTKNIILEVANFDMYAVRKTSMRHGIFTDALTRFNKGQSPRQNAYVLDLLMKSIFDVAGGEQASEVIDKITDINPQTSIAVTPEFINARLGLSLSSQEIRTLLENVELTVSDTLEITPPFWRTDLELPEDIVEEVGRLYGYDAIPRELPKRSTKPPIKNSSRELSRLMRETLSRAGANEVLTYSFVHEKVIAKAGQDVAEAYQLSNALSPDLQYYRLSVTPSLLDKVHSNVKAGYGEFALFEIGKVHSKRAELDVDSLPSELRRLALVVVSDTKKDGSAYYQAKTLLEFLSRKLGLALEYKSLPAESSLTFAKPFEPLRSARVVDAKSGQVIGIIGEYSSQVKRQFKLPDYAAGFELLPQAIELALEKKEQAYSPLGKYPSTDRDICFQVALTIQYGEIVSAINEVLDTVDLETSISPVDIYQPESGETKNITVRLKMASNEKTLSSNEVTALTDAVTASVIARTSATII